MTHVLAPDTQDVARRCSFIIQGQLGVTQSSSQLSACIWMTGSMLLMLVLFSILKSGYAVTAVGCGSHSDMGLGLQMLFIELRTSSD